MSDSAQPDYLLKLQMHDRFRNMTPVQIELKLAGTRGVEERTGFPRHHHRMRAMDMLFPSRRKNSWRERMVSGVDRVETELRKEYMIIGASNSTKTSTIADTLIELWLEYPDATAIYLASPYEDTTETGLWARTIEQWEEARDIHGPLIVPGKMKPSENKIVLTENNPLSFIKVATADQIGKLVGKKSKSFNVGRLIFASDELPEFKQGGKPFIRVINNLQSVPNLLIIGAGNFASPSDALGTFCEPECQGGYYGLNVHTDHEWYTTRRGLVYRFDGDTSPGLEDPEQFFFLPTERYREQLELTSGGTTSPDYYRYWHSFPLLGTEEFTITNMTKIRAGGALEEHYEWTDDTITYGSHCDPGFGGDPAIIQNWRMGHIHTADKSKLQIWEAWGPPITVPLDLTSEKSLETQIVEFHMKVAYDRMIPAGCCSFDGSLRSAIVHEYAKSSLFVNPIDSNGPATNRPISATPELYDAKGGGLEKKVPTWKEKVSNLITEQWMSVGSLIQSGQVRGFINCQDTAVSQLCRRKWKPEGKKKKLQTKEEYKLDNAGKSPNEADAVVGGVEMARRLGLKLNGVSRIRGGSAKMLLELREKLRADAMVKHLSRGRFSTGLPSGRLHGISRSTSKLTTTRKTVLNARLNR